MRRSFLQITAFARSQNTTRKARIRWMLTGSISKLAMCLATPIAAFLVETGKRHVLYLPEQDLQNSNWRGPIWLAVNFLLVESLLRFYMFYGRSLEVECPTGTYFRLSRTCMRRETCLEGFESRGMSEDSETTFPKYNAESKVRHRIGSVHAPRSDCGRDPA